MHIRGGVARLIESAVFTKEKMEAMGIPEGTLPTGWWIGFQVTDADQRRKSSRDLRQRRQPDHGCNRPYQLL